MHWAEANVTPPVNTNTAMVATRIEHAIAAFIVLLLLVQGCIGCCTRLPVVRKGIHVSRENAAHIDPLPIRNEARRHLCERTALRDTHAESMSRIKRHTWGKTLRAVRP